MAKEAEATVPAEVAMVLAAEGTVLAAEARVVAGMALAAEVMVMAVEAKAAVVGATAWAAEVMVMEAEAKALAVEATDRAVGATAQVVVVTAAAEGVRAMEVVATAEAARVAWRVVAATVAATAARSSPPPSRAGGSQSHCPMATTHPHRTAREPGTVHTLPCCQTESLSSTGRTAARRPAPPTHRTPLHSQDRHLKASARPSRQPRCCGRLRQSAPSPSRAAVPR